MSLILALSVTHTAPCRGDELSKLAASDGTTKGYFGSAVDVSGTWLLVGSSAAGVTPGSAYIFDIRHPEVPIEVSKFASDDVEAGDSFAWAVAISDDIACVGAPYHNVSGEFDVGATYLFDVRDPTRPTQLAKLVPDYLSDNIRFGADIWLDGHLLLVGAAGSHNGTGRAHLFDVSDPANPVRCAVLQASDGTFGDRFGYAVSMSGTVAAISSSGADHNGHRSGTVYLFDISDPWSPVELSSFVADEMMHYGYFGQEVVLDGALCMVGAGGDDEVADTAGAVFLFDVSDASHPQQIAKVVAPDGVRDGRFGIVGDLRGGVMAVASWKSGDNGSKGDVYIFNVSDPANPIGEGRLVASDTVTGDRFGSAVSVRADQIVVGAAHNNEVAPDAGAAYVFPGRLCSADTNGDGQLNVLDFVMFQLLWQDMDAAADCDANGEFDELDVVCVQRQFLQGCE